jgi:anti-sigma regulatory factor (Ser/Thr protein kinase)
VALHAYGVSCSGTVDLEISVEDGAVTVRMLDSGRSFDLEGVPGPDLSSLLERSMGLYIMRSFMDEVSYVPGEPPNAVNVMTLSKRYR